MKNSSNSAGSVNEISHSLAPCEGIFKFCHSLLGYIYSQLKQKEMESLALVDKNF